ncbi:hypothetical protein [Amycolatopsis aidingensis]|uniref:hypothetical protein n=1 Tax=Amycolatopsis aidingensis TaxID=2842453 RepID=UPI001C0D518A|nr:hypothetical protein [Amycolatopsis aidingensis]
MGSQQTIARLLVPLVMLSLYLLCHLLPGPVDHVDPVLSAPASPVSTVSEGSGASEVDEPDADCGLPARGPAPAHDADHPRCLAVPRSADGAAAGPVLLLLLACAALTGRTGGPGGPPRPRRGAPPVCRGGRDMLTALCVLRN